MMAMILAAGRGERMRPLTDSTPKPLLKVKGKPLIVHHIERLVSAGIKTIVINTGHLGMQIHECLGTGEGFGVSINYSDEGDELLETAGGIVKALPLLGSTPFIVTNADIVTDFDYLFLPRRLASDAHLVMVDNPEHNKIGDFALEQNQLHNEGQHRLTYSGIGFFSPHFFIDCAPGRRPLAPLLRQSAQAGKLTGQHYKGYWRDIGTPERLEEANKTNS